MATDKGVLSQIWKRAVRIVQRVSPGRGMRRLIARCLYSVRTCAWPRNVDPPNNEQAAFPPTSGRRQLIGKLGTLPVLSLFLPTLARGESKTDKEPMRRSIIITQSDAREYARLKALNLQAPEVRVQQKKMSVGNIGDLTVSRLISGSNLIGINMHPRDLDYVDDLARHYCTEERVFMTLKKLEEHGVNTIVLKDHNFRQIRLQRYWQEWRGDMQWLADVITTDIDKFEKLLVEHLDLGASGAYLWGCASDLWYHEKKPGKIIKAFEIMKQYDITVGIGAHRIEPIMFCEREGLKPDFYFKTFHHDRYWSAHPPENRRYLEMLTKESDHHAEYHDNMFCHNAEETAAFMQDIKVPWIAFKVMAAGAIPPEDGFKYAFAHGADYICVGMFDFQIDEDVMYTHRAVAAAQQRKRPWI